MGPFVTLESFGIFRFLCVSGVLGAIGPLESLESVYLSGAVWGPWCAQGPRSSRSLKSWGLRGSCDAWGLGCLEFAGSFEVPAVHPVLLVSLGSFGVFGVLWGPLGSLVSFVFWNVFLDSWGLFKVFWVSFGVLCDLWGPCGPESPWGSFWCSFWCLWGSLRSLGVLGVLGVLGIPAGFLSGGGPCTNVSERSLRVFLGSSWGPWGNVKLRAHGAKTKQTSRFVALGAHGAWVVAGTRAYNPSIYFK